MLMNNNTCFFISIFRWTSFVYVLPSGPPQPCEVRWTRWSGARSGKSQCQSFFHSWRKKVYELNHIVLSVVAIRCAVAVEQPREGELPRGAVTID